MTRSLPTTGLFYDFSILFLVSFHSFSQSPNFNGFLSCTEIFKALKWELSTHGLRLNRPFHEFSNSKKKITKIFHLRVFFCFKYKEDNKRSRFLLVILLRTCCSERRFFWFPRRSDVMLPESSSENCWHCGLSLPWPKEWNLTESKQLFSLSPKFSRVLRLQIVWSF